MPSYGDETSRGFYLRDGGYYFAINDFLDFKALGEIYTKGSWGLSGEVNYNKRYRYRGNFFVSFLNTVEGEKNMPDYMVTKSLKVQWTHSKDTKASPNTTFLIKFALYSPCLVNNSFPTTDNPHDLTCSSITGSNSSIT